MPQQVRQIAGTRRLSPSDEPHEIGPLPEPDADAADIPRKKKFRVSQSVGGLPLRTGPSAVAEKTGIMLQPGEVFEVNEEVHEEGMRADGGHQSYLRLTDGRGWAIGFNRRYFTPLHFYFLPCAVPIT